MKIGGTEVTRSVEVLVLPRTDGDIIIRAQSVSISDDFNALVPRPTAPGIRTKDGFKSDTEDSDYLKAVDRRDNMYWDYLCLRSLEPSEIEWEKVDLNKPETWCKWQAELMEAGLAETELNHIQRCIMQANALDEKKLERARESFLHGQDQ